MDNDIGCMHCGRLNFIFARGSETTCEQCEEEIDQIIEDNGGLDKCMNCGKYKYGNQLNANQTCIRPCRNPMEY